MVDADGSRHNFLSPVSGTVTRLFFHELDLLSYDSILFEYEECQHSIICENLCADCGINVYQMLSSSSLQNPYISMEPSFPTLAVSSRDSLKYDYEECLHLLRRRQLRLVIDLDQTLIHTTNSLDSDSYSPDIISYRLTNSGSQNWYTKLRPGVKEFLQNLQTLYQFHIVTFGDRPYANTIAKIIDPDGKWFSHRILSREESLSLTDKAINLNSLFPCGDSLVCIIDDREDVWNYALNLVPVKPYLWFKGVGDINSSSEHHDGQIDEVIKLMDTQLIEERPECSEQQKYNGDQTPIDGNGEVTVDNDDYLFRLETILKGIHTEFYFDYDRWADNKYGKMTDLKQIIPNIRRQILNSVTVCFSHLMPKNYPTEKHRATYMARAMGAKVTDHLRFGSSGKIQTTHVIAGLYTKTVHDARKHNVKVVTPEWLIDCYEQWEKKPEDHYILTVDYDVEKSRLYTSRIPRVDKRCHDDMKQQVSITRPQTISTEDSISHDSSNITVAEGFDIVGAFNKLYASDVDSQDTGSRPAKKRCTREIQQEATNNEVHDENFDSDSLIVQELGNFRFNEEDDNHSDEENLDDDEVPRGWKKTIDKYIKTSHTSTH